jgi:Hemerythrin HHE cation binding domain
MAKAKRKSSNDDNGSKTRNTRETRGSRAAARGDAIALLKADHREVEGYFEEFEKARSEDRKQELAERICTALTVHSTIEEEIYYPAFLEATEEEDLHHEAAVEHEGAKRLIADIETSAPGDDYFDARVTVLSEMIKHHVKEEEKPDGLFAKSRQSEMDLDALGEQLAARKAELMQGKPAKARTERGASLGR